MFRLVFLALVLVIVTASVVLGQGVRVLESGQEVTGKVTSVVGGGIFILESGGSRVSIVLVGMRAPRGEQPGALSAKSALRSEIFGRELYCLATKNYESLTFAICQRRGYDVAGIMVRKGYAWDVPGEMPSYSEEQDYAKGIKRGLWSGSDPCPPWRWSGGRCKQSQASWGRANPRRDPDKGACWGFKEGERVRARVSSVWNVATFTLGDCSEVVLDGVAPLGLGQEFSNRSLESLRFSGRVGGKRLLGEFVDCKLKKNRARDWLVDCVLYGENLAAWAVRSGHAWNLPNAASLHARDQKYAEEGSVGLWSGLERCPPWMWEEVGPGNCRR